MKLLSTEEAARALKISARRVRALIDVGRLPSQQIAGVHVIKESDLKLVAVRTAGRPPQITSKKGKK